MREIHGVCPGGEKRVKELEEPRRAPAREVHVASGRIKGRRAGEGTSEAAVQVQDVTARRTGPACLCVPATARAGREVRALRGRWVR